MARKTPGIYIAIRGDYSAFETDLNHARQVAKEQGEAIAKSIGNAVSAADITGGINKLTRELKTAQAALSAGAFKAQVSGLDEIAKAAGVSSKQLEGLTNSMLKSQAAATANRAFEYLQKNAGLSTLQLAKLRAGLGDTGGALSTLMSGARAAAVPVLAVGAAFGVAAKASFDATLKLDSTTAAFESITGSAKAAQEQLLFIRELSDRLGLSFLDTAQSAKAIFASAESTGLGMEKAQKAFQAVATAGTALKLTTDQMNRLNLAVSQVISKGRPMAEEMRQQIGEVLPGAMGLFAKSIGVTGKELDKMFQNGKTTLDQFFTFLDVLQNKYEEAAENASHSMQAELGRLKTSWDDFLVSVGDSDAFASVTRGLSKALDTATGVIKESELPNAVANLFKNVDVDVSGPTRAAAQIESEIAGLIAAVQKMPNPMDAAAKASDQLEASIRSQAITLDHWLSRLPDERFFTGIFGTLDELTPATREAFDEIQKLIAETQQTHHFQNFSEQLAAIGKRLETEGEMTARFRSYLEELQGVASRGVTVQLQLEGKEKFLQGLREVWQAWRLQNDPALATQKQWKAKFDALIAGHNQAVAKETQATAQAIERVNKVYDKSTEGKKKHIQEEINAIIKERDVFVEAVRNGTRTQKEFDEYSQKSAVALKKLREDQQKSDKKGAKSAEAAANRAAKALAAYDEEIVKLTQSSRELEQVKIEEKLRKIAKDAKLPAAEMDKLRKAMEQEADFKWMQDILSYADPAAAAIAKENKEFEAFRRNIERLKAQDPAKYTQLMTKAETEHEKALRKANLASKEQNEHTQEKLQFYKELEELTGQYGLSLKYQNELLAQQSELWRDAGISDDYINQWRELKELQSSHDWADGAQRAFLQYRADATDAAKGAEEAFSSLFDGMDSGWRSAWEQMIETGKVSLSSFRSLFSSFLADLMHMAITRPITVQIAGVVSGMPGTGGVASASGGTGTSGSGSVNIGGLTNLIPDSWTSGISGILGTTLPGTATALTTPGAYTAGELLLMQGGGTTAGTVGGQAALLSNGLSLGSSLTYGGFGSLGYSLLGGELGLPQNKYSGITSGLGGALGAWGASAALSGTALGATLGSAVPVVGTIIGAALGGLAGSLFGGERKTHPSVYTNVTDANLLGTDWKNAMVNGAWTDRSSVSDADPVFDALAEVAAQTTTSILDFAKALPEQYGAQVMAGLENATISFGRGSTAGRGDVADRDPNGATWNFQFHDADQAQEVLTAAGEDFQRVAFNALQGVISGIDMSSVFSALDVTTEEGRAKALSAMSGVNAITDAIAAIRTPTTEAEQQAEAFMEQVNALAESVKNYGLNAEYADKLVGEYRTAYVDSYVEALDEMFSPLSQIEQQAKNYKEAIDGYAAALTTMGASEEQLAKVRGYTLKMQSDLLEQVRSYVSSTPEVVAQAEAMEETFDDLREAMLLAGNATEDLIELQKTQAQAIAALQAQYAESFRQTYAQRYATLTGDANGLANLQQQSSFTSELAEIEKTWGKDSEQYRQMQALQDAEAAKQRLEQAQAAYDALQTQLEQQAVQLRIEEIQSLQTVSKDRISALEEELSAAQKIQDTWEDIIATVYAKRVDLYQGETNLDVFGRLDTAQGEFDRLYAQAKAGDADAAKEMAGVAGELLNLRGETTANRDDYLNAFYDVDKKLKEVSSLADSQVSDAQKQIDTLQAQLDAENAQYSILVSQLEAQQGALAALSGQNQTLASIRQQIANLKTQINITVEGQKTASTVVDNAQKDYDSAKDQVEQTKPKVGIYGSKYATEYDLMLAKVASLNRGEYVDPTFGITAGGWTITNARQAMIDVYGSVSEWYKNAGKAEGFATGGLTPTDEPFWVGEEGPELMMSPQQYGVLNNRQSLQLMTPAGTDGSLAAEVAKLREQNAAMARELRIANTRLEKMEKYAKETKDSVDEIRVMGIPVTVEATV